MVYSAFLVRRAYDIGKIPLRKRKKRKKRAEMPGGVVAYRREHWKAEW